MGSTTSAACGQPCNTSSSFSAAVLLLPGTADMLLPVFQLERALAPHCPKGRPRAEGSWLRVPQLLPPGQLLALLKVRSHSGRTFSQERMQTTRCGSPDLEYSRPRNIWWDSQLTALWPRQPLDRWQNKCSGSN